MSASQKCPECQAINTASAQWCAQCYTPFASAKGPGASSASPSAVATSPSAPSAPGPMATTTPNFPPRPAPAPAPTPASAPQTPVASENPDALSDMQIAALLASGKLSDPPTPTPALEPEADTSEGASWTCKACESINPLAIDVCHVCGISIFDGFGGAEDAAPALSLTDATVWSLIPGAGHMKMGHGLLGLIILIAVTSLWIFGVWLARSNSVGTGVLFILIAIGLLGVSVVDARTIASGGRKLLLEPRTLSVVFGVAIVGIMAVVWLRAVG